MCNQKLEDKFLFCVDCKEEFAFLIADQEYFLEHGITSDPERCRTCYKKFKKQQRQNAPSTNGQNQ